MVDKYALRVVTAGLSKDALSAWLSSMCSAFLAVLEVGSATEKEHLHLIIDSNKTIAALRKSFQRAFPTHNGNGGYSLKQCDDKWEDYMCYMCKGASEDDDPVVWLRQGIFYSDEKIKEYHGRYWVNNEQLVAKKRARRIEGNSVEVIEKLCKDAGVKAHSKEEIAAIYIRHMVSLRRPINVFAARAVVNTVSVLLDEDNGDVAKNLAAIIVG